MFGDVLKETRMKLHLTQQEMGDQLFVTRQTISNWEQGKNYPDIPTVILISDKYLVPFDYLLKGDADFMKKMEDDSKSLKRQKKIKIANIILLFSLVLILTICILGSFLNNPLLNYWIPILALFLTITLLIASYIIYKGYFDVQKDISSSKSLFIPKMYGVGLTINPNNPIGKFIWLLLIIVLLALIFLVI
ncbi:helix-turn-helix domain-containing protein [Enterococcus gilvus]|uniref:helix-turn-helix domain-containing protein n=1 Tax=Enterococcus gilvus TaxID=160453 RepID=UPI0028D38A67|nr:helix-turn-helix domain-containing protein [Enterococcus gilvus]